MQGQRRKWTAAKAQADLPASASHQGRWRGSRGNGGYPNVQTTSEDVAMCDDDGQEATQIAQRTRPRQFPRSVPRYTNHFGVLCHRSSLLCRDVTGDGHAVKTVCVIGGGPSGLGICRSLCDAGFDVTLVQESRGLGGKCCTKFVNGKDDPTLHFDMGVQLLRPEGPLRDALDPSIAQPWPLPGRFKRITCSGEWGAWSLDGTADIPTDGYVVGVPSMSSIGRHLAAQCKDLKIHLDRSGIVRGQHPKTWQWEVEWKREAPTATQLRYRPELANAPMEVGRGDFDAVFLAFEANKLLRGCKSGYKMVEASATDSIRRQIAGRAKTSQVWNLMVAFDVELPMPWDAATLVGHPALAWVAVNSSKPERARVPQCFQLLSTKSWANWKQWSKREVEQELLEELLEFLHRVLGKRPPRPCFVLGGRWGNNTETVLTGTRVEGEFPMKAVGFNSGSPPVVWDAENRMGAAGDWLCGFSVSDAYNAGVHAAAPLIKELPDAEMGA